MLISVVNFWLKMKSDLTVLQKVLGYQFDDPALLTLALSHRSIGSTNNERLEFLGDSLLNFFIAEALFDLFPNIKEGELSRLRAQLVKGETLAELAREMNLGEYLVLGGGELKSGGFRRASILADSVEALIGAIYRESGMDICRERVLAWFEARLNDPALGRVRKDAKTRLQEYMQERGLPLPSYSVIEQRGQAHEKQFCVQCRLLHMDAAFTADASNKRSGEQAAAAKALISLGEVDGE